MRLVYLSPVPWQSFAQRPHKFVQWFHQRSGEPVLWVDPYPTRFPQWRDLWRWPASAASMPCGTTPSWLTLLKPGGLPIEPMPGSGWVNRRWWQPALGKIDHFARNGQTLLAIGKPSVLALGLVEHFPHGPSLYDAMDCFPAFYRGFSRRALARRERLLAQQVDVIWASSTALKAHWGRYRQDVNLVLNGLDLQAVPAFESAPKPAANKVFGYVGTMAAWFDWDWVCALAEARPSDEIRLIGPIFQRSVHKLPPNVTLFPACDHETALHAMLEFDVGLIPFKKSQLSAFVDPIKYYEYRALGLPVISTDFGEMHRRSASPGVLISRSMSDAAALAESALQLARYPQQARVFARQNAWETRFDATKLFP